jgi:hypothetical protein
MSLITFFVSIWMLGDKGFIGAIALLVIMWIIRRLLF